MYLVFVVLIVVGVVLAASAAIAALVQSVTKRRLATHWNDHDLGVRHS